MIISLSSFFVAFVFFVMRFNAGGGINPQDT